MDTKYNRLNTTLIVFLLLIGVIGCSQQQIDNLDNPSEARALSDFDLNVSPRGFLFDMIPSHRETLSLDTYVLWNDNNDRFFGGNAEVGYGSMICATTDPRLVAVRNDNLTNWDEVSQRYTVVVNKEHELSFMGGFVLDTLHHIPSINATFSGHATRCWDGSGLGVGIHEVELIFSRSDGSEAVANWAFEIVE